MTPRTSAPMTRTKLLAALKSVVRVADRCTVEFDAARAVIAEVEQLGRHGEHEPGIDVPLRPCPFCGGTEIVVENTHTPFYTAECLDCNARGPHGEPTNYNGKHIKSARSARRHHREAFDAAVNGWNARR